MIFMIDIFLFFFGFEISSVNSAGCFQNASVGNNTSFKLIFFPSCDNFNYLYDDTQFLYGRNKVSIQEITVTCIGWYHPKFVKKKQRDVFQEINVAQVHELVFVYLACVYPCILFTINNKKICKFVKKSYNTKYTITYTTLPLDLPSVGGDSLKVSRRHLFSLSFLNR